jgi:hypothetical protein
MSIIDWHENKNEHNSQLIVKFSIPDGIHCKDCELSTEGYFGTYCCIFGDSLQYDRRFERYCFDQLKCKQCLKLTHNPQLTLEI